MKLGFVSSILEGWNFEEMVQIAGGMGFTCVEVACWPKTKAERRYAGVSHIDVTDLTEEKISFVKDCCEKNKVEISSLAFYPNTMDSNLEKRNENIKHLYKVIDGSAKLGINMVTTFIGRDQFKSVEDNLKLVREIWPPIINYAQQKGVKIAVENCPMLFDQGQWPGGQNLMTTPDLWHKIFEILPNENFGINYDPSHFVWQRIDYIKPIYEFKNRIFHVHFKDIKIDTDALNRVGILAYPLQYMRPKLPGLGDVDWGNYVSALTDIGYEGFACIEVEDRSFEGSRDRILDSLILSKRYMEQFVI